MEPLSKQLIAEAINRVSTAVEACEQKLWPEIFVGSNPVEEIFCSILAPQNVQRHG